MRVFSALLLLLASSLAAADPLDPYGPPAPPPGADEPAIAEKIAGALVDRAQELYDAGSFDDAKQLAVEALAKSPDGAVAERARQLIQAVNRQLGISDAPNADSSAPAGPAEDLSSQVDLTPIQDPLTAVTPPAPVPLRDELGEDHRVMAVRVHGGLYGGLLGATLGSLVSGDKPAAGAVPLGLVGGAAGAALLPRVVGDRWTEAQVRTIGAGSVWGGVIGGLFADAVKVDGTTARHVLLGASIGSTLGLGGGFALSRKDQLTRGDVALVDTLAGAGAIGGFTLGMVMQPAESEAYSVNAIVGAAGGVIVGLIAAPQTNTTPRRMLRVAGAGAIGAGVPLLLYAAIADGSTTADDRVFGLLSTAGLVGGLYLGFRLTRDLDVDKDVLEGGKAKVDDAPASVISRHSDGRWALGQLAIQPLSPVLAPQPGLAVPVVGATF